MADFVRYELEDGSEVFFESAEGSLVSSRGGSADVVDAGKLGDRLRPIAVAADEVSKGLRERLAPEQIELDFGVKVSGEVNVSIRKSCGYRWVAMPPPAQTRACSQDFRILTSELVVFRQGQR